MMFCELVLLVVVVAGGCDANVDSSLVDHLLSKNGGGMLREVDGVYAPGKGLAETYAMDVLLNLLMASKNNFPTAFSGNVGAQCKSDSLLYMEQVVRQSFAPVANPWALRMFESTGQMPQGLHQPNVQNKHAFGLFDECLAIRAENRETSRAFRGRYCTVYFRPTRAVLANATGLQSPRSPSNNWISIIEHWDLLRVVRAVAQTADSAYDDHVASRSSSFCVPSSCTAADVRRAVADLVGDFGIADGHNDTFVSILTATDERQCYVDSDEGPGIDWAGYAFLAVLALIGVLVVAATVQESVRLFLGRPVDDKKDSVGVRSLHCFSALNNTRKLLDTNQSADGISCLNGIRFLTAIWITFSHVVMESNESNITVDAVWQHSKMLSNLAFISSTVPVDTFFTISGMLVCYTLLRELQRNKGTMNILSNYFHRYLRLTPVYAFIVAFLATVIIYCGDGPYFDKVRSFSDECRTNWWTNLLYINNIVRYDAHARVYNKLCMKETWFLACDMQYYLISPLLVYPIWRWGTIGLAPVVALMSASLVANVHTFATNDVDMVPFPKAFLFNGKADLVKYYGTVYVDPLLRVAPFCVGMILGWLIYENKKTCYRLNKKLVMFLWTWSMVTLVAVVFGVYPYFAGLREPGKLETVLYGSFYRFLWALALSWVIYACVFGYAGTVNEFLSWKVFLPLVRLNYCVYLINFNYIAFFNARSRTAHYYTYIGQWHYITGMMTIIYALAFVTALAVEVPFFNLERIIFQRESTVKDVKSAVEGEKVDLKKHQ